MNKKSKRDRVQSHVMKESQLKKFTIQDIENAYHRGWKDKEDGEEYYAFGDRVEDLKNFKTKPKRLI